MPKSILPASLQIRTSGSASRASFWCLWCLASKASCLSLQIVCGGLRLAVWYFTSIWVEDPHSMAASYLWVFSCAQRSLLTPVEVIPSLCLSHMFLCMWAFVHTFSIRYPPLLGSIFSLPQCFLDSQHFLKSLPIEQYYRNLGLITHYL